VDPQNQLQIEEVTIEEGQQFINQEIPHVAQITTKSESRRNVSLF
jgi:GTPase Era involved in 16S rRNA processing